MMAPQRRFRSAPINGHSLTGPVRPFGAVNRPHDSGDDVSCLAVFGIQIAKTISARGRQRLLPRRSSLLIAASVPVSFCSVLARTKAGLRIVALEAGGFLT